MLLINSGFKTDDKKMNTASAELFKVFDRTTDKPGILITIAWLEIGK